MYIHVLMRDEKEERSKQGQTNKQSKATQHMYMRTLILMRDEKEERMKQARSNKQSKATQHMYMCALVLYYILVLSSD